MDTFRLIAKELISEDGKLLLSAVGSSLLARIACENERPVGVVAQIEAKDSGYHACITRFPLSFDMGKLSSLPHNAMVDVSADYI
jgi:hypothetical protein